MSNPLHEYNQNRRIEGLEQEVDSAVEDFRTLMEKIDREKRRNDVQTARIKALATAVEALSMTLLEKQVVGGAELANALAELRKAMEPTKV